MTELPQDRKILKSLDRSGHKEEIRLKFFPKVSFPHYKLNLCTLQTEKLRWNEKVITTSLWTWFIFLIFFFHSISLKVQRGLNLQKSLLSQTFVKWWTLFPGAVNNISKLHAIKNPMKHSKQHQHLFCMQYIVKISFHCFLTGEIFMHIHCICRAFFCSAMSIEWLDTINLSRHINTHRNNTDCNTLKHGICILEQNWTPLIEVSW